MRPDILSYVQWTKHQGDVMEGWNESHDLDHYDGDVGYLSLMQDASAEQLEKTGVVSKISGNSYKARDDKRL